MTSFTWKRRSGSGVVPAISKVFEINTKDEEDAEVKSGEVDWISLAPKRKKVMHLEDVQGKSDRLRKEGSTLAEAERYWEAIRKWDDALSFTPSDERLHEMKAQALISLCEVFPAIQSARRAVELNPLWWVAHQTLGRAHLSLGEVRLALRCFSRAAHINPTDEELWSDDLSWTIELVRRKQVAEQLKEADALREAERNMSIKIVELDPSDDCENNTELCSSDFTSHATTASQDSTNIKDSASAIVASQADEILSSPSRLKRLKKLPPNYVCMRY